MNYRQNPNAGHQTSWHGHRLTASVVQLEAVFGRPHHTGWVQSNTQFEWCFTDMETGKHFTIYDWQIGKAIDQTEKIQWNLGGKVAWEISLFQDWVLTKLGRNKD